MCTGFLGKTAGKKAFGRRRQRCKNNVNMDRQEISPGGRMDWIDLHNMGN